MRELDLGRIGPAGDGVEVGLERGQAAVDRAPVVPAKMTRARLLRPAPMPHRPACSGRQSQIRMEQTGRAGNRLRLPKERRDARPR